MSGEAPMKLLNPGPVTLTARVRAALARPDMCHREGEFADMCSKILSKIGSVYPASKAGYTPVLLTSSGTGAVEAMLSVVPRKEHAKGMRTLVVANGVYGERAAAMLAAQGKEHDVVSSPWTRPMDVAKVDELLSKGEHAHVFAVHHETTTGRLNDLPALGAICKKHGVKLLLDAVSSFAGEDIRFDEWNLEACAGTANKCIHGVPGIAFVLVANEVFTSRETGATSVYLDLFRYRKEQAKGFSPFTQSVHVLFALDEALDELAEQGGWERRHQKYAALTKQVREGLFALGVQPFLEDADSTGATLSSYRLPKGLTYDKLHDHLKNKGFVIYAGQGPFSGEMFRIAVMGDVDAADMTRLLGEIRATMA
jgi:2-aminoethylphosphonate-pyruvate transaminase